MVEGINVYGAYELRTIKSFVAYEQCAMCAKWPTTADTVATQTKTNCPVILLTALLYVPTFSVFFRGEKLCVFSETISF